MEEVDEELENQRVLTLLEALKNASKNSIDEMESNCQLPRIIQLLSENWSIGAAALDCILKLAYFRRKEVIEAMLGEDLVEKLMELQRFDHGSSVPEKETGGVYAETEAETKMGNKNGENTQNYPFESCVTRFAVQLEVGEGLNRIEKREFKRDILRRVREASVSDSESATIEAEVLWGSSPWSLQCCAFWGGGAFLSDRIATHVTTIMPVSTENLTARLNSGLMR
ncbi:hypothetical protein CJ030_MR4G017907 [Morella rubra]|uniref:Uncharacterized protein n=1 Tax=Morella rubra TaxID=262757 RepID=A0A6A1VSB8_9ROSI|nr:hypothetical protein CJ030_MR4G017907 [Morella rubra]